MPLGWIDFSKTERSKVLSILDLLAENGTLDELGIAPVRDGYSNLFFPGTSTIQTRAKYFFLTAYALKELELSSETNPNRILRLLDEKERACGERLLQLNQDESGVIGKRSIKAGRWVKRTPADIYWSGLRRYGFFTGGNISMGEYVRAMCSIKNKKSSLKKLGNRKDENDEFERDDENAGDIRKFQFWRIPNYTDQWFDEMTMALTDKEAGFLKEQIILNCPDSMMAFILKNDIRQVLEIRTFQDLKAIIHLFPDCMQEDYYQALSFSDFIYAIRTVYNVMISDGMYEEADRELERLRPEFSDLANLDLDAVLNRLKIVNNHSLRSFLKQVQNCMKNDDLEEMIRCIKNREIFLKGQGRAKTCHPGQFDLTWIGGRQLDYRFGSAKTIIRDIFESEVSVHA